MIITVQHFIKSLLKSVAFESFNLGVICIKYLLFVINLDEDLTCHVCMVFVIDRSIVNKERGRGNIGNGHWII
jgi:hypothetical protein